MKEPLQREPLSHASPADAGRVGEASPPTLLLPRSIELSSDAPLPASQIPASQIPASRTGTSEGQNSLPTNNPQSPLRNPKNWRSVKWLTPGLGVKRWGVLALLGVVLASVGAMLVAAYAAVDFSLRLVESVDRMFGVFVDSEALGVALLTSGAILVIVGYRGILKSGERAFASGQGERADFLEAALKRRRQREGEKIVAIGGGTGLSTMLRGLKQGSSRITAVVTMADDGGSSGMLREEGMLPPGDLRNCIAALAEAEPTMTELFQHRFEGLGALKGHSLGNLIVAAMCEKTGDFESAIRETSKVLAIRGRVLPSTLDDVRLGARLLDGGEVLGQAKVAKAVGIREVFLQPSQPRALPGVVRAIEEAEAIIIGPGSLFTSIIPNLLVPEIAQAIKDAKVPKIYVCNVMTQPGETQGFKASDHVRALIHHIGQGVITHVLLNNGRVSREVLEKYQSVGAEYVEPDEAAIEMLGVRPVHANFIDESNLVRHNPTRLASVIFRTIGKM